MIVGVVAGCSRPASDPAPSATAAPVPRFAAATAKPQATAAAMQTMADGGNAVDAAVAAAFALAVAEPQAGNLGGGGFMTLYLDGEAYFLDYREVAPAAAHEHLYVAADGSATEASSLVGHQASGVPGTVAGLWAAHQRFGRLPWEALLQPAIALARDGIRVSEHMAGEVAEEAAGFAGRTNFADYFGHWRAGERVTQPELAETLARLAAQGPDDFYRGETAGHIVAEMQAGGGLITAEDLAGYEARWRPPLRARWRDYDIITAPLPSSGGFALLQLLEMLDQPALAEAFGATGHNGPDYVHLIAEAAKRVFADRAEFLGDQDRVAVDLQRLLTPDYIARRAAEVQLQEICALDAVRPGLEGNHTTHFSLLDADGNAVANTYTLNTSFGSGVVVRGAGFLLNNEMDDFAIAPGQPNYYGVVGSDANAIAPGKRMLSSMTPTIGLRDGEVAVVAGAMGGSTIFTSVHQVLLNLLVHDMTPRAAVAAPRFHHQLLPPELITYTPCCPLPSTTVAALEDRGYRLEPHSFAYGNVQLIWVAPDGTLMPASEPGFDGASDVGTRP